MRVKRSNPQTTIFLFIHRKEKEITIIYQIKELIFNFQFLIFNFFLNPPVASQHPPLQREASPHKPLVVNTKTEKKKNYMNE